MTSTAAARRRFALEEFFALQLNVVWRRMRHLEQSGRVLGKRTTLLTAFYNNLPFDLTTAQKRSIREIIADMRQPRPMNRLLQGDVGSGKTVVAMYAMLLAVAHGYQAALMAPTEILARQHLQTLSTALAASKVRLALLTGSLTPAERRETLDKIAAGEVDGVEASPPSAGADASEGSAGRSATEGAGASSPPRTGE